MLQHITNLPNLFTSASIFCGFYSLILTSEALVGNSDTLYSAALAIIFAALFDALDGRVARMTKTASEFGIQYDSLADVISFGVAPAFLLYKWGLGYFGGLGLVAAFVYLTAGAMRLARFNIITKQMSQKWTLGLTITEAGGVVAALVMVHHKLGLAFIQRPSSVLVFVLVLAYLMVSNIRFRTFKDLKVNQRTMAAIGAGVLGAVYVFVTYQDFAFVVVFMGAAHIGSGLLEEVVFFRQRRVEDLRELMVGDLTGGAGVAIGLYEEEDDEDGAGPDC